MIKLPRFLIALLPKRLVQAGKAFAGWLRGWCDRLVFPFWLYLQCVRARRKAVVVWRTAAIGDVVCTLPMLATIRIQHPGCLLIYVTLRGIHDLVRMSNAVDRVYGIDHVYGRPSWLPLARRLTFGLLIVETYEPRTGDERGHHDLEMHLVDDMAASCGLTLADRQPHLDPPPEIIHRTLAKYELTADRAAGRLLIAINGGHTWPVREWQVEKWQELVNALHREYNVTIVQFGIRPGTAVHDAYDRLQGVRSFVAALTISELIAITAACDLVISIDSGPVHIAGAVGTPVVGLFGAVDPRFRLPLQSPALAVHSDVPCLFCHHRTPPEHWMSGCPYDIRCMQELTVTDVLLAARKLLEEKGHSPGVAAARRERA